MTWAACTNISVCHAKRGRRKPPSFRFCPGWAETRLENGNDVLQAFAFIVLRRIASGRKSGPGWGCREPVQRDFRVARACWQEFLAFLSFLLQSAMWRQRMPCWKTVWNGSRSIRPMAEIDPDTVARNSQQHNKGKKTTEPVLSVAGRVMPLLSLLQFTATCLKKKPSAKSGRK